MAEATAETKPIRMSDLRAIPVRGMRARFDLADTTDNNRRHWARADGLSADAAASPDIRRTLRNRCRYEVANNSYARGIVLTLANDTIGTGPRLQMLTPDETVNRRIEREFVAWADAIRLPEKLRTMRMARCQDGEAFGILATNPRVDHPVQLDLKPIEADQVTSAFGATGETGEIDGIRLDPFGNPLAYRVMKHHPGGDTVSPNEDALWIPAPAMIHSYRQDRPGQHRGTPEIAPALELFAQLRRFTLAVISAAESAANFAGILYTDAPPNGEADAVEPMDRIELERNMLLTMPGGWKMGQVEPRQPASTYGEFKHEILNEIARCLNMPFNIAAGNSSGYNYASGRLDHQTYYKSIRVDQAFMASTILDRILSAWLMEYGLLFGFPKTSPITRDEEAREAGGAPVNASAHMPAPARCWFWDGMEHVDPAKEANAQATRLKSNTTTLSMEYAKLGLDWEEALRQRSRERKLMQELGLMEEEEPNPTRKEEPTHG